MTRVSIALAAIVLSACASCGTDPAPIGNGGTSPGGTSNGGPPVVPPIVAPIEPATPVFGYRVIGTYPHDRGAFTQGLLWHDGHLYESTGKSGASSLRRVDLETGAVLVKRDVGQQWFCEGLALVGDRLVQLTWRDHIGLVWNVETLSFERTFDVAGEGWGLTYDGERLIMSDGTSRLLFLDPETYRQIGLVDVRDRGSVVRQLNELEFVDGHVLANVWMEDRIARIDPATGEVTAWIDLTGIISIPPDPPHPSERANVLNGIAWDPVGRRLFVTGKLWPSIFEIELVPPPESGG